MDDLDATIDGTRPPHQPADSQTTLAADDDGRSARSPAPSDTLPQRIGHFVPIRRLGRGGMGVVFEAHDPRLDRSVALKLLLGEASEANGIRLQREAQAMAKLNHPNVVQIYEVGRHSGRSYIAMELIDGLPLDRWLREHDRTADQRLDILAQAGRGLAAAHREGLVHRDFKPSNVLVGADGRARVLDFGLVRDDASAERPPEPEAKGASESHLIWSAELTRGGALMGTPAYMSPEQYSGSEVTPKSDQFGFCVTLYEAICGQHPHCDSRAWAELAYHIVEGEPRPAPPGTMAPRVERVIHRGLAKDPSERWPSMDDLLQRLSRARRRRRGPLALAAATVATAGVLALTYGSAAEAPEPPDRCQQGPAALREVWGDDHRQRVGRALTEANPAYGPQTWERVEPMIDQRAQRWLAAFEQACAGPTDPTLHLRCLERWRRALGARVDLLGHADASLAQRAVQTIGDLPSIAACVDLDPAYGVRPLPEDPGRAQEVEALYIEIDTIGALEQAGWYEQAATRAAEVSARAEALDFAPLKIYAWHREGSVHTRTKELDRATEVLERAYFEAEKHDLAAISDDIAALLVSAAIHRGDYTNAMRWSQHLRAALDRVQSSSGDAGYYSLLGLLEGERGNLDAAAEHHQHVLRLTHDAPEQRKLHAVTLSNLGMVRRRQRRFEDALELYARAASAQEALLGPDHPDVATTRNNEGIALYYLDRLPEAEAAVRRAIEIRRAAMPTKFSDRATAVGALSMILSKQGKHREAERMLLDILEQLRDETNPIRGVLLEYLGTVRQERGDHHAAEGPLRQALELMTERWGHRDFRIIRPTTRLARARGAQGFVEEAIDLHRQALSVAEALPPGNAHRVVNVLVSLAELLLSEQRHRDAVEYATRAQRLAEARDQRAETGFVLARARWALGETDQARALAQRALEDLGEEEPQLRAKIVTWLAETSTP